MIPARSVLCRAPGDCALRDHGPEGSNQQGRSGEADTLAAMCRLQLNAMETNDEAGIVDEVNFLIELHKCTTGILRQLLISSLVGRHKARKQKEPRRPQRARRCLPNSCRVTVSSLSLRSSRFEFSAFMRHSLCFRRVCLLTD